MIKTIEDLDAPESVEEIWGVELDDDGSADYYNDFETALDDAARYGSRLLKVTTEYYEVAE